MKRIFFCLFTLFCLFSISQAQQFAGAEWYPDSDPYVYARQDIGNFSAYVWSLSSAEVGVTIGPKLGAFTPGIGISAGVPEDKVDVLFYNVDLNFALKFGSINWLSYSVYQLAAQDDVDDFWISRHLFSFGKFPVGVMGHNVQTGNDSVLTFWGPCYQFGKTGPLSVNIVGICPNLSGREMYVVWITEF